MSTAPSPSCVPCLRVARESLFLGSGGRVDAVEAAVCEIWFDHGARGRGSIEEVHDLEEAARRELEALGPVELGCLDDCALVEGSRAQYVLVPPGDPDAVAAFCARAVPRLRAAGWRVELDPDLPRTVEASAVRFEIEPDGDDWFDLRLGVEVDGETVDLLPLLLDAMRARRALLELAGDKPVRVPLGDGRWVSLSGERVRTIVDVLAELHGIEAILRGRSLRVPAWQIGRAEAVLRGLARDVRPPPRSREPAVPLPDVELPPGLRADLRPYQRDGVAWLQQLRARETGGVLADDMGLGKTLQIIAHLCIERSAGRLRHPALVVAPTSLLGNWSRELRRFAPHLRVLVLRGPDRHRRRIDACDADVVLTSYPLLLRDRDALTALPFSIVVADEAQALKNPRSGVHAAMAGIPAEQRICVSGTPVENDLGELWALLDIAAPGLLGSEGEFRSRWRQPIEQRADVSRLLALREVVAPHLLRRRKELVASELPPKTEMVRAVELHGAQRDLYESIRLAAHEDVRRAVREKGLAGATLDVLGALLKLRQVCCDPRLVPIAPARAVLGSAKLAELLALLERALAQGRRVLVFSTFATMLDIVAHELRARRIAHVSLTGATSDRDGVVDAFQSGRVAVFLLSLKAGGTGLNLTAADTVVHYEPWWNPAAQAQATDRAHRIGQTRPVLAVQLVVAGSVEERILRLQERKRALADAILAGNAAAAHGLELRDIEDLLAPLSC